MKYWIGVASKSHVEIGMAGGFCQLCHGKHAPLNRMKEGDWLIYYAPKETLEGGVAFQKFMAVGQVCAGEAYPFQMAPNFVPFRKDVSYVSEVTPLDLRAVSQHPLWIQHRSKLRFGHFEIPQQLFDFIASAMIE